MHPLRRNIAVQYLIFGSALHVLSALGAVVSSLLLAPDNYRALGALSYGISLGSGSAALLLLFSAFQLRAAATSAGAVRLSTILASAALWHMIWGWSAAAVSLQLGSGPIGLEGFYWIGRTLFLVEILAWSLVVWQLRRELSLTGVIWPAAAGLGVAATCIAILPLGIELPHGSASLAFYGTLLIGARSLHRPELAGGANGLRPCDPNVQHTLHPEDSGSAERAVLFGVARGTLMAVPAILVAVAAILGVEYAFFQSTHTLSEFTKRGPALMIGVSASLLFSLWRIAENVDDSQGRLGVKLWGLGLSLRFAGFVSPQFLRESPQWVGLLNLLGPLLAAGGNLLVILMLAQITRHESHGQARSLVEQARALCGLAIFLIMLGAAVPALPLQALAEEIPAVVAAVSVLVGFFVALKEFQVFGLLRSSDPEPS
jgi:hypothetical protein